VSPRPAGQRLPDGFAVTDPDGRAVLTLRFNEFETRFFGRRIGVLDADPAALGALGTEDRAGAVALAVGAADEDGYRLVQAQIDAASLETAALLEEAGFRLADTRVEFLTRLDRGGLPRLEPPFGTVALATPADRNALLALTDEGLTRNPGFYSRYKDPAYFTAEETARWFAAWVENDLADPGTLVAVWRLEEGPVAFFGLSRRGEHAGLPLYKSTLAAAAPARRGHKAHMFLQTALFDALPIDEFWLRQVTQLTNTPIIRNNLLLGRRLDRTALTFFRRGPGRHNT
jgi:hypothetical protein